VLKVGDIVGDYKVLEEVGRGAEGRVYKVEQNFTRRQEAIKVLAHAGDASPEVTERFLREIRVQASLQHPQIASVHNAFLHGTDLIMVMELVQGVTLGERMQQSPPAWPEAVRILCQVLSALSYAHERGVVHRDITPANIVVGEEDKIKLTDFGLAWAASDMRLTRSGAVLGSVHYMAPEQVKNAEAADARSDIYACGVVLYEAVTGHKPFNANNAYDIMQAHVLEPPVPPRSLNAQIPPELNQAILKAMSKDPLQRQASADEFLGELAKILIEFRKSLEEATAHKQATIEPVKARSQRLSWTAAAVICLIVVAAAYGWRQLRWDEPQAQDWIPTPLAAPAAPVQPEPVTVPEAIHAAEPLPVRSQPAASASRPQPRRVPKAPDTALPARIYPAENVAGKNRPLVESALPEPVASEKGTSAVWESTEEAPPSIPNPVVAIIEPAPTAAPAPPEEVEKKPGFFGKLKSLNPFRRRQPPGAGAEKTDPKSAEKTPPPNPLNQ